MQSRIGCRVALNTRLLAGDFYGTIIDIDALTDLCIVQLDDEDQALIGVKWYDEPPDLIQSGFWQICYPVIERMCI